MPIQPTRKFGEVRKEELADVVTRRNITFPTKAPESQQPEDVAKDLVGLALSGGGGRSASFSLGIIQAFYRRGILKYVDFISSVSGGGYLAGTVSQAIASEPSIDWEAEPAAPTPKPPEDSIPVQPATPPAERLTKSRRLSFTADASGRQPDLVRAIGAKMTSLRRPFEFFSRHLWGLITVNLFVITGIMTLTAGMAFLMKSTSGPRTRLYLAELGLRDDITRELAPSVFLLVLWMLAFFASGAGTSVRPRVRRLATILCVGTVLTSILGVINIFGAGDVSLSATERAQLINPRVSSWLDSILTLAKTGLAALFAASFLPYLKLPALIESGTKAKPSVVERWLTSTVSTVVVLGIPLFCYYLMAAENVSQFQSQPANRVFTQASVRNWSEFYERVLTSAEHETEANIPQQKKSVFGRIDFLASGVPGDFNFAKEASPTLPQESLGQVMPTVPTHNIGAILWRATSPPQSDSGGVPSTNRNDPSVDTQMMHALEEIAALDQQVIRDDASYWAPRRWLWFIGSSFSKQGTYQDLVARRIRRDTLQRSVLDRINHEVLSNPTLYLAIKDVEVDTREAARVLHEEVERIANRSLALKAESRIAWGRDRPGRWLHDIVPAMAAEMEREEVHYETLGSAASPDDEKRLLQARIDQFEIEQLVSRVRRLNFQVISRALARGSDKESTLLLGTAADEASAIAAIRQYDSRDASHLEDGMLPVFYPLDRVFGIAVYEADQAWRLRTAGWSLLLFLLVGLATNLNHSSMHGFYRDNLGRIWCPGGGAQPLSELKPWEVGGPIPLWTGTFNRFSRLPGDVANATAMFLFSPKYCGTASTSYVPTEKYLDNALTVSEVMAISGAAVSPAANVPLVFRAFLILTNFRFGQWLPMPSLLPRMPRWAAPLRILYEWRTRRPENRDFAFVSDGGHCENLGIAPLLQRRCRLIIAVDSGYDPDARFLDLGRLLHSSESEYGVTFSDVEAGDIPLSLKNLIPADLKTPAHVLVAQINYPETPLLANSPRFGYLVYIKPSFTGDESAALRLYRDSQRDFPNDPTIDQFFEPQKFEAYRQLGDHIAESVWRQLWKEEEGDRGEEIATANLHEWSPWHPQRFVVSPSVAIEYLDSPLVRMRRIAARALAIAASKDPGRFTDFNHKREKSPMDDGLPFSPIAVLDEHLSSETDSDVIRWLKQAIADIERASKATPREQEAPREK